ncbi:FUSC family protein [Flavobacterium franklandianum]|uniref:FUSC family protein n=1 Tax=Flavobacterium franklandianum TaxID=2594430 RepID=A0A553C796_9FLAO|nr:FUSC family membrane protein [Flavobacterium franklandianum]TRX16397.1 FUSC family protein [Flavobacterium franklandianum]
MFPKIKDFTIGTNLYNALKVVLAAVIPAFLFSYLGNLEIGLTIAIGALFTFPSDTPSNLKHKINGLLVTVFILAGVNLLINATYPYPILFYPVFAILVFTLSMLAVYGQRATMVAFSALMILSISLAHTHKGIEMLQHSGLLLCGGLFYLLISIIFYYINPHRYTELQIVECIKLTSKYLKLRGDLWELNSDRKEITRKQLILQVELNNIHENIREVLVRNRTDYGSSHQNRKMLLAFMSLVEIMELAVSTSFDHNKLHQKFDAHPKVLTTYQSLAYNLAKNLKSLSKKIKKRKQYIQNNNLIENLFSFEFAISDYEKTLGEAEASEGVHMLSNMLHYAEKQVEKIKTLERAYTSTVKLKDLNGRDKDLDKLTISHYYPLNTLVENFSFSSLEFRHSLRITTTLLIGLIIGKVLPFENVYWILLTIVVIMRPGYGLTKERTLNRFIGTLIGGVIGFAVLALDPSSTILAALTILFLILGLTFNPSNYKIGTTFITLHVIFIFAILNPSDSNIVLYRVLDTFVGAILAILANHFLWPYWESLNTNQNIKNSIEANRNYLKQISILYNDKEGINTKYRLARNQAFIEIGNLMASFQRMLQEPKSKQDKLQQVYKFTVVNNALLSSAASLGTYTQSHKTTKASKSFNFIFNKIIKNLDSAISILKDENNQIENDTIIDENLNNNLIELKKIREQELAQGSDVNSEAFKHKMREAQLVIEQLIWLTNLSENILKTTKVLLKTEKNPENNSLKTFFGSNNPEA